ncbi:MAG: PilZ domain-containing protein [Elusimicrobiota bacterium]
MSGPSKRLYERYPCDIPIVVQAPRMKNRRFDGIMRDVGMGGALLSIHGSVEGPLLIVEIETSAGKTSFKARIARAIGMDKKKARHYLYGVMFETDLSNQHILRKILDQARAGKWSGQTGTDSGETRRDYWNM